MWISFEDIIGENYHQIDWGGELNDIYTTFFHFNNKRTSAAFMLKGRGTKGKLTIQKAGKNGDQILRLVKHHAQIYIIQHIGEIAQEVREDIYLKIKLKRLQGEEAYFCIIDGTDTTRILKAYGHIP